MKAKHLILPYVALATACVFLSRQRESISRLQVKSVEVRKHIATSDFRSARSHATRPKTDTESIDWVETAGMLRELSRAGGLMNMSPKVMSFYVRLQEMDKNELLAALDQIEASGLDDGEREMLENRLIPALGQKDPQLVFSLFHDRLGDENAARESGLDGVFDGWAKNDQIAAIVWLDREIAAGTFNSKSLDGKSPIRLEFEKSLITQLISTDLAAGDARLAALPADQRKHVLDGYGFMDLKGDELRAYSSLVRTNLTVEERNQIFGPQVALIGERRSLEQAANYLDGIGATGEERIKAVERAVIRRILCKAHNPGVHGKEIASMREWLGTQAPGSVERVTGEALSSIIFNGNFPDVEAMVWKYHEQGGGDELLTSFLDNINYHRVKKEELRELAEKISDPKKREEALGKLK